MREEEEEEEEVEEEERGERRVEMWLVRQPPLPVNAHLLTHKMLCKNDFAHC